MFSTRFVAQVGGLALLALVAVIAAASWATAQDSPSDGVPVQARPDGSEGDIPAEEAVELRDAALADEELAAVARLSDRFELLLVQTEYGDEKWDECASRDACAYLVFYDWSSRQTVTAWLARGSKEVILIKAEQGSPTLTDKLQGRAAAIALQDKAIVEAIGSDAHVDIVTGAGAASGPCARDLCALVGLTRAGGEPGAPGDSLGALVDLHLGVVVHAQFSDDNVIVNRSAN